MYIQPTNRILKTVVVAMLIVGALTACTSALAPTLTTLPNPSAAPETATLSLPPSNTLVPTRSRTPIPKPTPTATPTLLPTTVWTVPVIEIVGWPSSVHTDFTRWEGDDTISIVDAEYEPYLVNAATGAIMPEPTWTPYRFDQFVEVSTFKDFEIRCSPHNLEMYRLTDQTLIGQMPIQVETCEVVQWAHNGLAASVISSQGDIYVWPTDGNRPYAVGQTTPYTRAVWSPNDQQLLMFRATQDGGEGTFDIAFVDGRPIKETGAVIEAGNGWEIYNLTWLTDDIVSNVRQCGNAGACLSYSFFDAATGKYLIGYIMDVYMQEGQQAILSPNGRWLALDTYMDEDVWEKRYSYENRVMVLYDLHTHQKHVWAKGDDSIKFVGWAHDSSTFYFVHYPFDQENVAIPTGYLKIGPTGGQASVVVPNVLTLQKSPDEQAVLIGTSQAIGEQQAKDVSVGLYTLDGHSLSAPQLIIEQVGFESLQLDAIPVAWSNDSTRVVLLDGHGNLWLIRTDGEIGRVASSLPTDLWPEETYLGWSPSNTHL